jgi:hypothetical protein
MVPGMQYWIFKIGLSCWWRIYFSTFLNQIFLLFIKLKIYWNLNELFLKWRILLMGQNSPPPLIKLKFLHLSVPNILRPIVLHPLAVEYIVIIQGFSRCPPDITLKHYWIQVQRDNSHAPDMVDSIQLYRDYTGFLKMSSRYNSETLLNPGAARQ